jgi:hypothetical protein
MPDSTSLMPKTIIQVVPLVSFYSTEMNPSNLRGTQIGYHELQAVQNKLTVLAFVPVRAEIPQNAGNSEQLVTVAIRNFVAGNTTLLIVDA